MINLQVRQALSNLQSNSSHNNGLYAVSPRRPMVSSPPPPPPQTLPPIPPTVAAAAAATTAVSSPTSQQQPAQQQQPIPMPFGLSAAVNSGPGGNRLGAKGGRNSTSSGKFVKNYEVKQKTESRTFQHFCSLLSVFSLAFLLNKSA